MELRGLTAVLLISILPVFVRLLQSGLRKPRNLLLAYLGLQIIEAAVSLGFGPSTSFAFWLYIVGSPIRWVLYVALISEIYAAVFSNYPGIRTVIKSSMLSALLLASLFSSVLAWYTWREHAVWAGHLYYFELAQRTVLLTLIFFVLLLFVLVSRYPLRADHNLLASSLGFCALFSLEASALLLEWVYPGVFTRQLNLVLAGFSTICYVVWAVNLRTSTAPAVIRRPEPATAAHEDDLLQQLSAINATLLRAFGR
ncbi:MAG TPA: hypothetical protein DEQ47_05915 [Solibacterales bacterium]|nr:hypothetical protein [Bryobacterales bacterium]